MLCVLELFREHQSIEEIVDGFFIGRTCAAAMLEEERRNDTRNDVFHNIVVIVETR